MKNFLLSSDRSAERKLKELILSVRLEQTLTKDQILELYLNEIFLGQNSFGVAAAAQTYFNKTLGELAPQEAAYLAALPQRPSTCTLCATRMIGDFAAQLRAARDVRERLYRRRRTMRTSARCAASKPCRTAISRGSAAASAARLLHRRDPPPAVARLRRGRVSLPVAYTVRATVDPELQEEAARALRRALEKL